MAACVTNETAPDPHKTATSDYKDSDSFQVEAANHVFTFYPSGSDRLAALLDHIECAQLSLEIFYYQFQDDGAGQKVRNALVQAAYRGVAVSLMIDDFGSDAPDDFFAPLVEAGGQFSVFSANWNVRYLVRNHQKFAIADGARVMTGGANISDQYYNPPTENGWCDLGMAIEGEVAERFAEWFSLLSQWIKSTGSQFRRIRRLIRDWDPGSGEVQLLMGGPLVRRSHWSYRFKQDLAQASQLDMVTAYFGPPGSFRRAMARVAKRGNVRMIAAGKSDLHGSIDAARLYYKRLIQSGASIFEFQPSKLHMKLLLVDDQSYFGSANLDRRSIRINVELMVRVKDQALADRLRKLVGHLESASIPIDRDWYASNASFLTRLRWRFFHWLSIADYRVARSVPLPK